MSRSYAERLILTTPPNMPTRAPNINANAKFLASRFAAHSPSVNDEERQFMFRALILDNKGWEAPASHDNRRLELLATELQLLQLSKAISALPNGLLSPSEYLSEYLTATWDNRGLYSTLVSVQCCMNLLHRNPDLQELVEKARTEKDSNILNNADLPRHPAQMIYYRQEFQAVFELLETMRAPMEKIVDGTAFENLPRWNLKALAGDNPDIAEHIKKLNIPNEDSQPLLLLHEIGSFQSDPKLNERLEQVFAPTRNTFLVNSSGTGKTRLLYEGLCKHWGLFFTAVIDSYGLGSTDVYGAVKDLRDNPMFTPVLMGDAAVYISEASSTNHKIARRIFGETLLARLLVFKLFVDLMARGEIEEIHKTRWFLAQIQPLLFGGKYESLRIEPSWSLVSDSLLADCISQCLEDIAAVFSRKSMNPHFFVVLDEANVIAEPTLESVYAFRDTHGPHPVLKEIMKTWNSYLRNKPFTIVVGGTDIPRMYFGEGEWDQWHWISSTGAFSNLNDQQQYVLKFLPNTLVDSPSGQHLLHRMWVWLRGRHRFTAAFISTLVENGFQSPHYLMNTYLEQFTGLWPTDADEHLGTEVPRCCPEFDGLPLEELEDLHNIRTNMQHILMKHLIGDYRLTFSSFLDILCVSMGFGHFIDNKMETISAEEPLVLIATAQWLSQKSLLVPNLDSFLSSFHFSDEPLVYKSDYLALATALCFKTPHLVCDIFSFSASSLPVWASQHARLVALRGEGQGARETVVEYSPKTASQLVFSASRATEVLDWMKDARGIPFCKHIGRSATTLYFILRLEDYTRFWVVLRAVPDDDDIAHIDTIQDIGNGMTPIDLLAEDDTLNEGLFEEALQALPNRHPEIGLLRVLVSLHDKINLEELEFDASDTYPVASFNISMIRDAMIDVSQKDVLSGLVVLIISDVKQNPPSETESELSVSYRPPPRELSAEALTPAVPSRRTKASASSKQRPTKSPTSFVGPSRATATRSTKRKVILDVDSERPTTGSRRRLSGPSVEPSAPVHSSRARRSTTTPRSAVLKSVKEDSDEDSDVGRTLRNATTRTTRSSSSIAGAKRSRVGDDDNDSNSSRKSTRKPTQDRSGPSATGLSPRKTAKDRPATNIAPKSTRGRPTGGIPSTKIHSTTVPGRGTTPYNLRSTKKK
ncbi:hypothetical protein BDP27DRAFT_1327095 [Rhodocollybia butyracea]|uniref:Uncharacterized protein n=1 Tax=Rhodocollybia butyracea TaxID=206335 RepID=A0A9P5U6Y7_9AGAR|nr:hypothetical protein BDP27DRAFT_1327095 [Rhodocollybia butyracea]